MKLFEVYHIESVLQPWTNSRGKQKHALICNDTKLCQGVIFDNGRVSVCWVNGPCSIVLWNSMEEFESITVSQLDRELRYLN